jgi:hypothetical protein
MEWEHSLLSRVDWLADWLAVAVTMAVAFVVIQANVWRLYGWQAVIDPTMRYRPRHGGVGTRHRWQQPYLMNASRATINHRSGNLYSVRTVLMLAHSNRGERLDRPGTVVFPRDPNRKRVQPIRPHELNIIQEFGTSVVQPREEAMAA